MDQIVDVRAVSPYILEVAFASGGRAWVDVESELYGEVFEPLRDAEYFMRGAFDPEQGTIVWPNGADFSPEYLAASGREPSVQLESAV